MIYYPSINGLTFLFAFTRDDFGCELELIKIIRRRIVRNRIDATKFKLFELKTIIERLI
jgi:hypothetical protein